MSKQKMDILLRDLVQQIPEKFVYVLTGHKATRFLDNTFPSVKERRADFILELDDCSIFHLEFQSQSDRNMHLRMLEYYVLLKQRYPDRPIRQMVLFAGEGNPRMENELKDCGIVYTYEIKSMKEIKCRELMESNKMEDKILAVLCNIEDFENYIKNLAEELMEYPEKVRQDYLEKLSIALKYRPKLKLELKRLLEERKLPLTITEEMIKQDPFFQEGLEGGKKEGVEKGKKEIIQKIYQKGILSPEEIADLLELPLEFVKEAIAELQKGKEEK